MLKSRLQHNLLKIASYSVLFICLSTLFAKQTKALQAITIDGNSLELVGIGVHSEQNNDIYIGALFSSISVDNLSQLLNPDINKRMSLKFISKYSNRKMSRLWKQRIAMNSAKSEWQPRTKEIVSFAGLFKRSMQAGDELNIDYDPIKGTHIYLNGTLFLTITETGFFDLLLKVWIGAIPPTKKFKIGISGKNKTSINEKLINEYQQLQPQIGRFDEDKPKEEGHEQVAKASTTKGSSSQKGKKAKKSNRKKKNNKKDNKKSVTKTPLKPKRSKSEIETTQLVDNFKASIPPPITSVEIEKPVLKFDNTFSDDFSVKNTLPTDIVADKPADTSDQVVSAAEQAVTAEQAVAEEQSTKPKIELETETKTAPKPKEVTIEKMANLDLDSLKSGSEDFFDVDLYRGSYKRELIATMRRVQWYPKKALMAGEQGEVRIKVIINKEGRVIEKKVIQHSASRILNRSSLRMVSKAQPFPKIPDEFQQQQFEFEVPLSFTLEE